MRIPVLAIDDGIIIDLPAILTAISKLESQLQLSGSTDMETM